MNRTELYSRRVRANSAVVRASILAILAGSEAVQVPLGRGESAAADLVARPPFGEGHRGCCPGADGESPRTLKVIAVKVRAEWRRSPDRRHI